MKRLIAAFVLLAAPAWAKPLPALRLVVPLLGDLVRGTSPQSGAGGGGGGTTLTDSASLRTALSDETGTGAAVFANTPTLVTPALGAATGTSIAIPSSAAANAVEIGETANRITFEGATADAFEGRLGWTDPTVGDQTILLPNLAGASSDTIAVIGTAQTFTAQPVLSAGVNISGGTSALTSTLNVSGAGSVFLGNGASFSTGNPLGYSTTQTPDAPYFAVGTLSESIHIMEYQDLGADLSNGNCGTSACVDPTLIIHSHNQTATEYGSISHDGLDMTFRTGVFGGHYRFKNQSSNGVSIDTGQALDLEGNTYLRFGAGGGIIFNGAGGYINLDRTLTAGGTTGAQTINKTSGSVNFAASATTLVVTDSLATATSLIWAQALTNDTTCSVKDVERASGSFTIRMIAACTGETVVGFLLTN